MTSTAARTAAFPDALDPVADRVEQRIDTLLAAEIDRWNAVDPALVDPLLALRDFVAAGGKRLAARVLRVRVRRCGGRDRRCRGHRRRGRARTRAHVRARTRRHHGRLRHPARPRRGAPSLRPATRRCIVAGSGPALRRRHGHPRRRLRARIRRHPVARCARGCAADLRRATRRAVCRPVARSRRDCDRAHRRGDRASHRDVQVGQVHGRTPAASRRRTHRPPRRARRRAVRDRAADGRGVPVPRRRARRVRRIRR